MFKILGFCVDVPIIVMLLFILISASWLAARYVVIKWTASSEFGTYRLCEQRRFRRACACAQSRQNLRCSLIQAVSQEEPSDRKPDHWPLWMAGHAQLKCVMTECSKTQIRLAGLKWFNSDLIVLVDVMCLYSGFIIHLLIYFYSVSVVRISRTDKEGIWW